MQLIDDLEKYRESNGFTQDQMAEKFGLPTRQNYDNWVRRRSIPKAYVEKAREMLGHNDKLSKEEKEIIQTWRLLGEESKRVVLTQFRALRVVEK